MEKNGNEPMIVADQDLSTNEDNMSLIRRLYIVLGPSMLSYVKKRLYGVEAEDVVQSVFCTVVRKADIVCSSPNPEG